MSFNESELKILLEWFEFVKEKIAPIPIHIDHFKLEEKIKRLIPEENESTDKEIIEKKKKNEFGNSVISSKIREKVKDGKIDYTLIAYIVLLILAVLWLLFQ